METPGGRSTPARPWPVFLSLQHYRRGWLRADVLAGLTVWAVLVPEALAYASIAGVPVPGSLLAVLLGIAAVTVFDLDKHGVAIVGHIDAGLPSVGMPDGVGVGDLIDLLGPAVGVLLIGFAEGLGAAKTYAAKAGYEVDANRELFGLGAANLGSGLSSGMVVNGSLSKTAVNGSAGARTQLSGLVVAVLVVLTLLFLTGLFENLPEATLAGVVIAAVIELVDIAALRRLYRVWTARLGSIYGHAARADFLAAIAAMAGVLLFDTLPGLVIGIGVSMLLLLYRTAQPHIATLAKDGTRWVDAERRPELERRPDVLVVRVESGLLFANADYVKQHIEAQCGDRTKLVVLDAETSPVIDVTAAQMLAELRTTLARRRIEFAVARDVGQFRDALGRSAAGAEQVPVYPTVHEAIDALDR